MKSGKMKDHGHTCKFYLNYFLHGSFEYGDGVILELLRWMQKFYPSTRDHEMLHADSSSKDEHLLMRPLLRETKIIRTWLAVGI
jgi:hypothetical protein